MPPRSPGGARSAIGGSVSSAATTRFRIVPTCSIVISTTSPTWSGGGVSEPVRPQDSAREPEAQVPEASTSPAFTHDARDAWRPAARTTSPCGRPVGADLDAVDADRHREVEEPVCVAAGVELVGGDDPRADRRGEVLALRRAELELHLPALHVAGRPVVHHAVAADGVARLRRESRCGRRGRPTAAISSSKSNRSVSGGIATSSYGPVTACGAMNRNTGACTTRPAGRGCRGRAPCRRRAPRR